MNLVIGSTSQLARYFPKKNYRKISSRKINLTALKKEQWESIYITFAEQRIYTENVDFVSPNYLRTLEIIEALLPCSQKIVCYGTCELWNGLSGQIDIKTEPSLAKASEYSLSKLLLWNKIEERRHIDPEYLKVIMLHPFYFNSAYRSGYFLFGKIFDSIIYQTPIKVGSLDFYRDMVSPEFVVQKSIEAEEDAMVGSGKLVNIRYFVRDLYKMNGLSFEELITEDMSQVSVPKMIAAKVPYEYDYERLLMETQIDIEKRRGEMMTVASKHRERKGA